MKRVPIMLAALSLLIIGDAVWAQDDGASSVVLASVDFVEFAIDDEELSEVRGEGLDAAGPLESGGDETAVILWDEEPAAGRGSQQDIQVGSFGNTINTAVSLSSAAQ